MRIKEQYEKENERKGLGSAVYGRDKKPKAKSFKAQKDDGERKLHPARFESLPRVAPAKYWKHVPTGRSEVYRHLPLQHLGVEGVAESTIVKLHNRKVPVELAMLRKEPATEVRHVEQAVWNYVLILRSLHPADHGGLVLHKVMADAGWGEMLGENMKDRVGLLKKFFDEAARENSGRAVRKEPPMDHEEASLKWVRTAATAYPALSMMGVGQQMLAFGAGKQGASKSSGQGGGQGGQGATGRGGGGGRGGGRGRGGAAATGTGGGVVKVSARFNGLPVCFKYNSPSGCSRRPQGTQACVEGNTVYAHMCNHLTLGPPGQPGTHCYALHPKFGNH